MVPFHFTGSLSLAHHMRCREQSSRFTTPCVVYFTAFEDLFFNGAGDPGLSVTFAQEPGELTSGSLPVFSKTIPSTSLVL